MGFEAPLIDSPKETPGKEAAGSSAALARLHPSAIFRCRLCWQIALIVTLCIIVIEAVILIPSYVNYERDLLNKLEDVGLASVRTSLARRRLTSQSDLRVAGKVVLETPEVIGLAIHGPDDELIVALGETPALSLVQVRESGVNKLRSKDGRRLSVSYTSARTGHPFDIIANMDASWVADELTAFVWRIVGLVFLITFFVSSATLLVVGLWVLRPIFKIREKLVAVQKDPRKADHFVLFHPKNDEIGDMVSALGVLMKHLSDYRHSELLAKESRFQDFADVSSDWFWEMDEQLRFSFFSERFSEVTGIPEEALLGRTRQETGLPGLPEDEWRAHLADLAAHRTFRDFRHPCRKPNGQVAYFSINGRAIFDEDGNFKGYRGTGSDVTKSIAAEEALQRAYADLEILVGKRTAELARLNEQLREGERRYRELFDESPVAIWEEDWSSIKQMLDDLARGGVRDMRGYFNSHRDQLKTAYDLAEILEISRAALELYHEESREDILRRSAAAVVVEEELDAFLEIALSFLAGQTIIDLEAKDVAGDGSEIIVRRQVVMPPKYRDDWSRVIYAIEDITERTQVEEQLRQAQKMEAVGQLTGGVAHDFNNLLAIIQGNAELLAEDVGTGNALMQPILRASARGAELTHRLLAFSRQQPLRSRPTDLAELVGGISGLLKRTLGEAIDIETVGRAGPTHIMADPGQIENALLNLGINARDAMPGGGKLTIECQNVHLDEAYVAQNPEAVVGDYVVLAVSDTGTGMSAEVQAHAFEPFFTTKEVGKGSGLGLSMVYGFVKQSGGQVTIYSEEGRGTTVKLYLPRAEGEAQGEERSGPGPLPQGLGETILVIEDDADVCALAVKMLQSLGYQTIDVADASSAGALLAEGPMPDLVLSDVVLPGGMSGPDFADRVRATHPGLKVIFMSGYPAEAAKRNGFLGSDSVLLNKPFQRQQLATALREALD